MIITDVLASGTLFLKILPVLQNILLLTIIHVNIPLYLQIGWYNHGKGERASLVHEGDSVKVKNVQHWI